MSQFDDIIKNELTFVRNYVRDLPFSLVIAFADSFNGNEDQIREKQRKIFDMYRLSLDKSILNLRIAIEREVKLIVKADGISIKQDGTIMLRTRGDTVLIGSIDQFGDNATEIENNIREWLLVTVTTGDQRLKFDNARIIDVEPLQGYRDVSNARRILNEYAIKPIDALLLGFGIKPCFETYRLYFARFASQFFYNGKPIHVIQLTNTDSGKSYFAVRMEFVDNWTHFTEFPSPAKLIFDGRTGIHGAVFTSRGIAIDEFDKLRKERFLDAYQSLNTGLENGIWRRGVQTISGISLEGYRYIPFLIFGNIIHGETPLSDIFTENSRTYLTNYLTNQIGINAESFVERFALIDIVLRKIPISKYLIRNDKGIIGVLKDSIIRGLISEIENKIKIRYLDTGEIEGRLQRHAEAIYHIYDALFDMEPEDTDFLIRSVTGELDIGNLFVTPAKEIDKIGEVISN